MMRPIVNAIRAWREHRRRKREQLWQERYDTGYQFAMSEYYAQNASLLELEACVETQRAFNHADAFDDGVWAALMTLNHMGMPNVYQPD